MLSKQDKSNLTKINKILKESFGFTKDIDSTLSKGVLKELKKKAQENMSTVVESSEFNTYHKNKDYNQSMLVVEAVNILLNRKSTQSQLDEIISRAHTETKSVSASEKVFELKNMYESYVAKNGEDEKASKMKDKITAMEKKIYNEDVSKKLSLMLKEDADKAEAIMSARGLLDDMIEYQAKIGETQNKYLDPFIEKVRSEYSNEMADNIYEKLNNALTDLLSSVRDTKEVFANVVGALSGDGDLEDMSPSDEGTEDLESDDLNDDELDLEAPESDESGDESEADLGDLEDELGLGGEGEGDETGEFRRREE